ncbi:MULTISPECIES: acyl-CoA dehydrogenase [unclassified Iodidimonas]|jgi:alkylation response protein AidB-like acyl-CoA dehydrogenase|uniref:acyl-CoA dehydrogenase n=1 Tax=unclassified Iodidimonas TaxID=2626145 RepID=UPI00248247E3|nr:MULTISPECIES: acyl-CoA dehydrogenase [unclassified Iodidimonas]
MTSYRAPVKDIQFTLETICDWPSLTRLDAFVDATPDVMLAVIEEAAKLSAQVIAPLNRKGDLEGSRLVDGKVVTPDGFADAYRQYVDGGWNGLSFSPDWGGQGLPFALALAVQETWTAANMAFSLCPMLTQGAIEALTHHGSDALKALYLEKLVTGEWTGTMNLTEPQAGSDVGALKSRAEPNDDGSWKIFGQKIYITWGDHDMADNIIHLVLARTPGAPAGTKGISLFVVPKFLPDAEGRPGVRNDVTCVSLEHKLGIHASPTCVLQFGDEGGAIGWLVGEENRGMRCMFTMMNHARINVGLQGVSIAERAYQQAVAYARDRVQSADISQPGGDGVPIIRHADVRRMLMTMKANTEAVRAIAYYNAAAVDRAHFGASDDERKAAQRLADLLTPVTKAFATDLGVETTSLAIQIHGGMGYVEETGVAQHYRDARIAPIYEGTNGIQAMDLVGRKLMMEGGRHWRELFQQIRDDLGDLPSQGDLGLLAPYLEDGLDALQNAAIWLSGNDMDKMRDTAAGAAPFLRMFGAVVGGWLLMKQAMAAQDRLDAGEGDPAFLKAKITTARFFAEQLLPPATALLGPVTRGSALLYALDEEDFAA